MYSLMHCSPEFDSTLLRKAQFPSSGLVRKAYGICSMIFDACLLKSKPAEFSGVYSLGSQPRSRWWAPERSYSQHHHFGTVPPGRDNRLLLSLPACH